MNALQLWRAEVDAGVNSQQGTDSTTWRFDALWRAACYEASAEEFDRDQLPVLAAGRRAAGDRHILQATSAKRRSRGRAA